MISLKKCGINAHRRYLRMVTMKTIDFKLFVIFVIFINLVVLMYFAVFQHRQKDEHAIKFKTQNQITLHVADEVTVIIREYEDFENKIPDVVLNLRKCSENISIIIIGDDIPYPPFSLKLGADKNTRFISLKQRPDLPDPLQTLKSYISTKFVLIIPDAVELLSASKLADLVKNLKRRRFTKILAAPISNQKLYCRGMNIDLKSWTVHLNYFDGGEGMCDSVGSDHAILIEKNYLFQLSSPFSRPLHISLYMQFILRHWKTSIYSKQVFTRGNLFRNYKDEWMHKHKEQDRLEETMKMFGIKQVIYDNTKKDYFGCTKDTKRCFDTVINDMPDYIQRGKWTPPCCLKAIRETARHVFEVLSKSKVRYWLEGGSLLGAVRHKDIIPWDYDVDIGIYQDDIKKCDYLLKLTKTGQFIDDEGFQWEKATEGSFMRVHFSDINRNHVDIFPFYSKSGKMTKDTWLKTHRQDTEFSEHYLKPLVDIEFIGMNVSAPNNYRNFLEYKFGAGVIENPKYPNAKQVLGAR